MFTDDMLLKIDLKKKLFLKFIMEYRDSSNIISLCGASYKLFFETNQANIVIAIFPFSNANVKYFRNLN